MNWRALGSVLPDRLADARLELHYAAQLVSAPGTTLLPATADFSHTNLAWDSSLEVLAGRHVGDRSLRAALVFESLELAVLEGTLERGSHELAGSTMDQSLAWLRGAIADGDDPLSLPSHEMPAHPLGEGGAFSEAGADARAELAAWFANATAAIEESVAGYSDASTVRCWPHHFDAASQIELDRDGDAEAARNIGVGFSPGDGSYDQPYFYVTPWPYPDDAALPSLSGQMRWHTAGWTGAVLTGDALLSVATGRQAAAVCDSLQDAVGACRTLLGA